MGIRFGPSGCGEEFYNQGYSNIFDVPKSILN